MHPRKYLAAIAATAAILLSMAAPPVLAAPASPHTGEVTITGSDSGICDPKAIFVEVTDDLNYPVSVSLKAGTENIAFWTDGLTVRGGRIQDTGDASFAPLNNDVDSYACTKSSASTICNAGTETYDSIATYIDDIKVYEDAFDCADPTAYGAVVDLSTVNFSVTSTTATATFIGSAADFGTTMWNGVKKASPFLLVLLGTLLVVSIAFGLLKRASRGIERAFESQEKDIKAVRDSKRHRT